MTAYTLGTCTGRTVNDRGESVGEICGNALRLPGIIALALLVVARARPDRPRVVHVGRYGAVACDSAVRTGADPRTVTAIPIGERCHRPACWEALRKHLREVEQRARAGGWGWLTLDDGTVSLTCPACRRPDPALTRTCTNLAATVHRPTP